MVGDDPASAVYVRNKEKDCADCGFLCLDYHLSADTTEAELLELIAQMNDAPEVDGILVQLPLPKHLSEETAIRAIAPEQDPLRMGMGWTVDDLSRRYSAQIASRLRGSFQRLAFLGEDIRVKKNGGM